MSNVGWIPDSKAGEMIGSQGYNLGMEAFKITLPDETQGEIEYRSYIHSLGWESDYKTSNEISGTTGKALPLEAIQVRLTGELGRFYEAQYRTHISNIGWTDWVKDDEISGKAGGSQKIEGIQIKLTKKEVPDPEPTTEVTPAMTPEPTVAEISKLTYRTHAQDIGWQNWVENGQMAGTTGQSKRLEAVEVKLVKR